MDSSRPFIIGLYPGLKNEAYGIACDIGSTTIAMHLVSLLSGRIAASSGTLEPADPLRRGPDEPRLLRDDEPGRPRGHDQGRARGRQPADRQGLRGRRRQPRRHLRLRLRRQPDHAPPVPRHRPDRARPGAVRARRVGRAAVLGARDRHRGQPRRAPLHAALHRRPCRRRRRRRDACPKARTGRTG